MRMIFFRTSQNYVAQICGLVAVAFLLVFFAYPLSVILLRSFSDFSKVLSLLSDPYYLGRLWFSFWQAALSTLLTIVLALPTALLFARYSFPGKRLLRSLFTVPFVMPTVVTAIGFMALAGPNGFLGINFRNSLIIVLVAHIFYNYAVLVRIVSGHLENLGERPFEVARMLGAGRWRIFWQVALPLATPAILAASVLIFIFCFTSFGVIMVLAPDVRFATLEVEIYKLSSRFLELELAAGLVMIQLIIIMSLSWLYTRLQRRFVSSFTPFRVRLRPDLLASFSLATQLAVVFLLLLAPLLALVYAAFWQEGSWLPSLHNANYLLSAQPSISFAGLMPAIINSLSVAALSMSIALFIGFCFAYAVSRANWTYLDSASLLPLATSAVTLGFGYLIAFPQLRSSIWGLALAHSLIAFPFVVRSLLPALRSMPETLSAAARNLGASPWRILWRLELPLLSPSLISAASFAFAVSMGEFGASLTLQSAQYATLPIAIFDRLGRPGVQNYGAALVLACILMLITTLIMLLFERYGKSEW